MLSTLFVLGCGDDMGRIADGGLQCSTEGCRDPDPDQFACQDVIDVSGRDADAPSFDALRDSFARLVLKRPGVCPTTLGEVMDKLRLEDRSRCEDDPRAGMLGRIVSQRAQVLDEPDVVRAVVGRQCDRRAPWEMLFETARIDGDDPKLPDSPLHVMSFDPDTLAFNFYALEGEGEGATWSFHGNSFDLIDPVRGAQSACGGCHGDGGLAMREIDAPWVHWESPSTRTIGADIVVDRFSDLGTRSHGPEFSATVQAGNAVWTQSRLAALFDETRTELHGGTTAALLRPLFCASTINLQSAGGPDVTGRPKPVSSIPSSFFVDPMWNLDTSVSIDTDIYAQTLIEIGSRLDGIVGPRDTFFGFTFVERAASDVAYVNALIDLGVIDEEFALDVLSVDFTHPVFSAQRCALLDFAPSFAELGDAPDPPNPGTASTSCCEPHQGGGCEDDAITTCVCERDEACCEGDWDQTCVNEVIDADPPCGACPSGIEPSAPLHSPADPNAAAPSPTRLRNALYARLDATNPAEGTAAASLRDALAGRGQAEAHRDRVARYLGACGDRARTRDPETFVRDALDVAAWRRREAQTITALLDEPAVVVIDELDPPMDLRLDPVRCELD